VHSFYFKNQGGVKMKKLVSIIGVVCFGVFFWIASALCADPIYKIRFGHVAPPPHPQNLGALHFKAYVEGYSGGRIQVSNHPLGQLGGEIAQAEAVTIGTQEMASVSARSLVSFLPELGLACLPFFYLNFEEFDRVWTGDVGYEIMGRFNKRGMYCLAWGSNGFGDWVNSRRLIHTPEDLKGMKLRSVESPIFVDSYKALGADPITMPWPEVFTSLQQKVIDGLDLPTLALEMLKFYEAAKYLTITSWDNSVMMTIVNKSFFDRLPKDLQQVVREGAFQGGRVNLAYTLEGSIGAVKRWKEKGGEVYVLTPEERAIFKGKMLPVYAKWKKSIGEDLYERAVKILEATRAKR
jgi:tripartite ATP-independent transporter DctP family solute receptor